jgi:hypothetical protein
VALFRLRPIGVRVCGSTLTSENPSPPPLPAAARATRYEQHLHEAFLALALDESEHPGVRAAVAGSLNGIIRTLGREAAAAHLKGIAVAVMRR